jgi:hypothetical protein
MTSWLHCLCGLLTVQWVGSENKLRSFSLGRLNAAKCLWYEIMHFRACSIVWQYVKVNDFNHHREKLVFVRKNVGQDMSKVVYSETALSLVVGSLSLPYGGQRSSAGMPETKAIRTRLSRLFAPAFYTIFGEFLCCCKN